MKIVFINNLYKPYARGGAEKVVEQRALKALEQNNEVTIITLAKNKSEHNQVFWDGKIIIIRIYPQNIFSYFDLSKHNYFIKLIWHFIDIFGCMSELKQILLFEKPNIVETHNLIGLGVYKVHKILKSLKSDVKWNHYLHDVQLVEPSGVLAWDHQKDSFVQKIYSKIIKQKFRAVDEVISPSKFLKEFYKKRGFFQNSEFRVQNLQSMFEKKQEKSNLKLESTNQELKFLFVGSLTEHKGIRVLMKAWDFFDNKQGYWLNIVGDGNLCAEVEEWSKNKKNVQMFGRLESKQLENIYNHSDILIIPSICLENYPTVILEAQKYGLQIIASDTGGIRELVAEENLFEPKNVEELVKKIKEKSR